MNPEEELEEKRRQYERWMRFSPTPPPSFYFNPREFDAVPEERPRKITADDLIRAVELMKDPYPYQQEMLKTFYGESEVEKILKGGTPMAGQRQYDFNPTVREVAFMGDAVILNPEMVRREDVPTWVRDVFYEKFYIIDYMGALNDYIYYGARSNWEGWNVRLYHPATNRSFEINAGKLLYINNSMVNYTSHKLTRGNSTKFIQVYDEPLAKLNEKYDLKDLIINGNWIPVDKIVMNEETRLKDWQKFIDSYLSYHSKKK